MTGTIYDITNRNDSNEFSVGGGRCGNWQWDIYEARDWNYAEIQDVSLGRCIRIRDLNLATAPKTMIRFERDGSDFSNSDDRDSFMRCFEHFESFAFMCSTLTGIDVLTRKALNNA